MTLYQRRMDEVGTAELKHVEARIMNVESGARTAAQADGEIRAFLDLLRCPANGGPLKFHGRALVSTDGTHCYPIDDAGIVEFAATPESSDAQMQQAHYDRVADAYITNLSYP